MPARKTKPSVRAAHARARKVKPVRARKVKPGELKAEIQEGKADIREMNADLRDMRAIWTDMHEMKARIVVLLEEQKTQTIMIIAGIACMLSRQDQLVQRLTNVADTLGKLAAGSPAGH